jgi:DNA mismatch repair protein MutS
MADTALMEQYRALKEKHAGAILLFQIGDFYETFEEDAHIVSSILGITLTKRNNGKAGDVALAGFPVRALDTYVPKLLEAGYRIAICDQVEDPRKSKGIVRREVTEILTPAVYWAEEREASTTAYLAVFWAFSPTAGSLVIADISSSGQVLYHTGPLPQIEAAVAALRPVEVLLYPGQESLWSTLYPYSQRVETLPDWYFDAETLAGAFAEVYGYSLPKATSLSQSEAPHAAAVAALLNYLRTLKQTALPHLSFPRPLPVEKTFLLDKDTLRNLEVIEPLHPEGKSLLDVLRLTATPAGLRLLRTWLSFPLREIADIEARLDRVQALYDQPEKISEWVALLRSIGDLERRVARLSARKALPRDIGHLYFALKACEKLRATLPEVHLSLPASTYKQLSAFFQDIEKTLLLNPAPPYAEEKPGEGKVIREGVDEKLDRARYLLTHAKEEINRLEEAERVRLGIPSLKIQENRQLGYVFHITAAHQGKIPSDYRLRQQLAQGAARYSNPALDRLSAEIASAQEVVTERETACYAALVDRLHRYVPTLQAIAQWVAEVDVYTALATAAHRYKYTRPTFTLTPQITIRQGRHPVIERYLPAHQPYQPNDLYLTSDQKILLLTGPNMAGKSAYMRQNALILLLAQIGSFVPAASAEIHPVDQIFSRIGASDNLAAGQSTFLVEMQETARILHEASPRSFVILDEIGRGTSTYDGLAIAWAVVEHLHNDPHCRPWTLFATHYHELTDLEKALPRLANFHLAVEKRGEKLVFLHQLRRGAMRRSFGLAVAEMAGIPPALLARAQVLLRHLEKQESPLPTDQPTLFQVPSDTEGSLRRRLLEIDPNTLTPIEALFKLQELRSLAQKV